MKKFQNLVFIVFLIVPLLAKATPSEWQIDLQQSSLGFNGMQNSAPIKGQFKSFKGDISVDPDNYQASSIHIIVDMNSLSVSYADIKNILISADWFDVKQYPTAEFKANQFKKTGNNQYQAIGTLTLRGKTLPLTLTFTTEQPSSDTGVVTGNTTLARTAFGVGQGEWSDTKQVKDEVKIDFKIVAKRKI